MNLFINVLYSFLWLFIIDISLLLIEIIVMCVKLTTAILIDQGLPFT